MSGERYGANSFWEMAALTVAGGLASCQSCVEFFYFQSRQNALAFLDSCAEGGLLEKVSLLDLRGDIDPNPVPMLREWYDQAIYVPTPALRNENLDAARGRIENTKNAVYNAFHLYYEVLGADDAAIDAAYLRAISQGKLRNSEKARERQDVDLSPIAKLRLILDGYKHSIRTELKAQNRTMPDIDVDKQAIESTVDYVLHPAEGDTYPDAALSSISDHAEELEKFTIDFLDNPHSLRNFWPGVAAMLQEEDRDIPEGYDLLLLPVISELVRHGYNTLKQSGDLSRTANFVARIRKKIAAAQEQKEIYDQDYIEALSEFREDLDVLTSEGHPTVLAPVINSGQFGAEVLSK